MTPSEHAILQRIRRGTWCGRGHALTSLLEYGYVKVIRPKGHARASAILTVEGKKKAKDQSYVHAAEQ